MDKNKTIIFIIGLVTSITTGVSVYNYSGVDVILPNGETIKSTDLPKHTSKSYKTRDLENTDSLTLYIHHTAVSEHASLSGIANYHVNHNGWPGIGYHSAIHPNGDIYILNSLETISYHTRGDNTKGISIVLLGNYNNINITDQQLKSLTMVTESLCNTLPIKAIKGHRDAKNANTSCPGDKAYKTLSKILFFN